MFWPIQYQMIFPYNIFHPNILESFRRSPAESASEIGWFRYPIAVLYSFSMFYIDYITNSFRKICKNMYS